jgi:endonuclease/exonuclease/phosphatase family metal-dependent hydrolase
MGSVERVVMGTHAAPDEPRSARRFTGPARRATLFLAIPAAMIAVGLLGNGSLNPVAAPTEPSPSPSATTHSSVTGSSVTVVEVPPSSASRSGTRVSPTKYRIVPPKRFKRRVVVQIPESFVRLPVGSSSTTQFTVASFNVLGASHTAGGGDKRGFASAASRMSRTVAILRATNVSVVGFQEFQAPQLSAFVSMTGGAYAVYPGMALGNQPVQNSIAWRRADWSLVSAQSTPIPYFRTRVPMPQVLLRNVHTGREVWFANFHNPADKYGNAQGTRNAATAIEASLARGFIASGRPVIITGDMNERESFYCRISAGAPLHGANGAYRSGSSCRTPSRVAVDWILGSSSVQFSNYQLDESVQARRISDHYMIRATASLPPATTDKACIPAPKDKAFRWCPPSG